MFRYVAIRLTHHYSAHICAYKYICLPLATSNDIWVTENAFTKFRVDLPDLITEPIHFVPSIMRHIGSVLTFLVMNVLLVDPSISSNVSPK